MKMYWSNNGTKQKLADALQKLIPAEGPVQGANPALELFRCAVNCYYDLYNNGLGNRAAEFNRVFGFSGVAEGRNVGLDETPATRKFMKRVEIAMTAIIVGAAAEQKLS